MTRISLFYGHVASNIGDLAINRGVERLVDAAFPEAPINVVLLNVEKSQHLKTAKASFTLPGKSYFTEFHASHHNIFDYLADPGSFLRTCNAFDSDLCLINSGEHLFSNGPLDNVEAMFWRLLPAYAAKALGKRVVFLPSTFGPFNDEPARRLMTAMLGAANGFAARDGHSQKILARQLGLAQTPLLLDPAFFIEPGPRRVTRPIASTSATKTLGLVMRLDSLGIRVPKEQRTDLKDRLANGDDGGPALTFATMLGRSFLRDPDCKLILFVQTDADADLADQTAMHLRKEGYGERVEVRHPNSIDDYLAQLGEVDHVVASRFHALILSLLAGTPVSAVYFSAHGHKIPGLVASLGLECACVELDANAVAAAVEDVMETLNRPKDISATLATLTERRRETAAWLGAMLAGDNVHSAQETLAAFTPYAGGALKSALTLLRARAVDQVKRQRDDALENARQERQASSQALTHAREEAERAKSEAMRTHQNLRLATATADKARSALAAAAKNAEHQRKAAAALAARAQLREDQLQRAARAAALDGRNEIRRLLAYRLGAVITDYAKRPWLWPIVPLRFIETFKEYRADQRLEQLVHQAGKTAHSQHRKRPAAPVLPSAGVATSRAAPTPRPANIDDPVGFVEKVAALIPPAQPPAYTPISRRACYVLHNSLPYSSGGYASRAQGLASAMNELGFEVFGVTRPGFPIDIKKELNPAEVPKLHEVGQMSYRHILKPSRLEVGGRPYLSQSANALEKVFRELRPSVVIAASNYISAVPPMIAARRLGVPFIYEARGFWEITRMSRDPGYEKSSDFMNTNRMEALVCELSAHTFTLTPAMREEIAARGVSAEKVSLLPNSCDVDRFTPAPRDQELALSLGIPKDVPVIGYIGTFVDYEGLEDLAAACADVKARGRRFRLMLVGNENVSTTDQGPITGAVRAAADAGGFSDWLLLPGRVPHDMVARYYSLIDIAPFPRKPWPVCEMVSPMKPLEAMAMEKAVLVSSVRALSEMVQPGETGLIYEKTNQLSLADALVRLIDDVELRARLGRQARTWVTENRTWKKTAQTAIEKIESLLAEAAAEQHSAARAAE